MAANAYVLIRTAPGMTKSISSALRTSPAVQSVEVVTGPYDLIALIEGASTDELLAAIMNHIRPATGIRDTLTCLVVPEETVG